MLRFLMASPISAMEHSEIRSEVLTGNELRGKIGYPPSKDPQADKLLNKNIAHNEQFMGEPEEQIPQEGENQNEV